MSRIAETHIPVGQIAFGNSLSWRNTVKPVTEKVVDRMVVRLEPYSLVLKSNVLTPLHVLFSTYDHLMKKDYFPKLYLKG